MKKIQIQNKYNQRSQYEENFSILNQNIVLNKNESNKRNVSCISCFSGLKLGLFLYILILSSFVVLIVGAIGLSQNRETKKYEKTYFQYPLMIGLGTSFFVLCLFLTIVRIVSSPITRSLKEFRKDLKQPLEEYIEGIKQSTVELIARCECYHETSSTTTNSDGSTSTTTSTVVTYREAISVPIDSSQDLTNPLVFEEMNKILANKKSKKYLIVSFIRYWYPSDQDSQETIKSYLDYLTYKNQNRDSSFRLILELNYSDKRFKEYLLFPVKSFKNNIDVIEKGPSDSIIDHPPFLFRYGYYILSLFLFLHIPYELYFNSKVYKSKFSFIRTVKVSTSCQEYIQSLVYGSNESSSNNNYNTIQSNNYQRLNEHYQSSSYLPPIQKQEQQKEKSIILDKVSDNQQNNNNKDDDDDDQHLKYKSINNIDK